MRKQGGLTLNNAFSNTLRGFALLCVAIIFATIALFALLLEQGADAIQLYAATIIVTTMALAMGSLIFSGVLYRHLKDVQTLALTDQLTGILNRTALAELRTTSRFKSAMKNGSIALISLDVDDFKQINDDCGHCIGDLALQRIAEKIVGSMRETDKVFRTGGDEFLCIVYDRDPETAALCVLERLEASFRRPMHLNGLERRIELSVGTSVVSKNDTWESAFHRSDGMMYKGKHAKGRLNPAARQAPRLKIAM